MSGPVATLVNDYKAKTSSSGPRWEAAADVVVLGSGAAGLSTALRLRERGLHVLVVTKGELGDGNTRWAQGGIAAVLDGASGSGGVQDGGDSVSAHAEDTATAGAGLCEPEAVAEIVAGGAEAVATLRRFGAVFDEAESGSNGARELARTREGGHSALRVIHAGGDATGAEVQRALVSAATGGAVPVLERHVALDAVRTAAGRIVGVTVLDDRGCPGVVHAPALVLATGGLGQLYGATSNPELATGDGVALALRAGATVADLEFVQFHPTVLYAPGARGRRPLVTEAVRGEGAVLVDATGARVMAGVHPLADLAPRDVVSAAVIRHLAAAPGGVDDHVFLDATGIDGFAARFPTVRAACEAAGVDPVREPIPVAPAAHFACGGVVAGTDGRTPVPGLYAVGEVARTGLHGANRLASNSLLEGLVVGGRAADAVAADLASCRPVRPGGVPAGTGAGAVTSPDPASSFGAAALEVAPRDAVQRAMSRYAAIGRDADGLAVAGSVLDLAVSGARGSGSRGVAWTRERVEDAALTLVARALVAAASARTESRGCHVRTDFPERDDASWRRSQTIRLSPSGQPVLAEAAALEAA
ncbi:MULTISPECIES: L-aspartate oxidase [Prauserella salsuginis group]|uniref:L-aspartate oxidase n=1 Tax=Prauserella salsuginis TaxID=387889 RepID=A0ABW6GB73_9PSEU|nr:MULTISPECIES: L-aspartate oxidase [Prauserella salsuginis group]MCR3719043.1 L-aspartate oxidase [Prauserella flava]MCR3733613.1 L-aspartate oxidase [Prauserella salsuginis]